MCSRVGETHIPRDICSHIGETHIPSDMFSRVGETHIPSDMCFQVGETHISSDMCSQVRETCIPRDRCSQLGQTHILRDMCSQVGKTNSLQREVKMADLTGFLVSLCRQQKGRREGRLCPGRPGLLRQDFLIKCFSYLAGKNLEQQMKNYRRRRRTLKVQNPKSLARVSELD